ncbi:MAG TPA: hypothetical protein VMN38_11560 [Sphingomicrobium sp.]|nr:hypothetical protein [Sphingomicrobium sp.]
MARLLALAAPFLMLVSPAPGYAAECAMSAAEKNWVEGSLAAWNYMADRRLKLAAVQPPTIIVFNDKCRFEAKAIRQPAWAGEPHSGSIRLPDGNQAPAQVTSFASHDDKSGVTFFVMALPPIWAAAKIPISNDLKGLTGVFLHELSHVRQVEPLKPVFEAAEAIHKMDDDFSDDSLQEHFQTDPAYVAVIEKERDLLYRAAAEPDAAAAKKLAAQALALMEARQKRWFVGEDAYWKNFDDLFLTMEGFGQWVAYAWLADAQGGNLEPAAAIDKMRGGKRWWSQDEGLALFVVIDRFVLDWPSRAFARQPALGIDLLRLAVREDDGKTTSAVASQR